MNSVAPAYQANVHGIQSSLVRLLSISLRNISGYSNTSIGKDAVPDFLSLAYYAGNYDHKAPAELPMEMQDTYVRPEQHPFQWKYY